MARVFENWLKAYMAFTADSEAPDDFHFWTGVSTIAGALRRRVWIDMKKFQWTPNFYIIMVAPPGIATKSTAMRSGINLLRQVKGVHFGPPSLTWQALTSDLSKAIEHLSLTIDGIEKFLPMSCLTVPVSELGTFLKADDQGLVDVITDLWDGQLSSWGHKTKTAGEVEILNPWLNVIACTTPAWLKNNIPEQHIGGGLMSRVIFVYGDKKRKLVPYPDEAIPTDEYRILEEGLITDLIEIATLAGEYRLAPDARTWGSAWYLRHWNGGAPAHMTSDRYEGYLSRKQTHMHKLAIILSAARSNELIIPKDVLVEAEELLSTTEPHMMKAFESVGIVDEARHVATIVKYVKAYKRLNIDILWGFVMNVMDQKAFNSALVAAARGGLLEHKMIDGKRHVWPADPAKSTTDEAAR